MRIYFKRFWPYALTLCSLFLVECQKEKTGSLQEQVSVAPSEDHHPATEDSTGNQNVRKDSIAPVPKVRPVSNFVPSDASYTAFVFPKGKKDSAWSVFDSKFSEDERYMILALNRLDSKNKKSADTLVVPTKIEADFRSYSPFPGHLDVLKDVQKMVIFSYPIQAFAVYSGGNLEKWGPTSMGKKKTPTKTGLTFANWKKELSISSVSDEWKLPYNFNIFNHLGIGWHEYDLPGYPASHSCLRLLKKDAQFLFGYADQWILNPGGATTKAKGTPVLVYGDYPWGKRKPWRHLLENPKANDISEAELTSMIQPQLDKILQEQQNRIEVMASMPKLPKGDSIKI